jgi:hypothetical protein
MQDHEEYLQAYVRRFLRLRAQASTVPNEIVIEAMIKGLRPGPTAQYFARKPPHTLEKLLQKMDKYIRADNDFGHSIPRKLRGSNKALSGRQLQEAEAPGASEEGLGINLGKFIAYSVVRTRAILQGCAMSPFRNKRK